MTPENTHKLGLVLLAFAFLIALAGEYIGAAIFLACGLVCWYG